MTKPKLSLEIRPSKDGKVYYLPLAPKSLDHPERLKVAVQLKITHIDPGREVLTIQDIQFEFPGTGLGLFTMARERENMKPWGGVLTEGETATWCNGSVKLGSGEKHSNQIYLDSPPPPRLRVKIYCRETAEPFTQSWELIPCTDPTGDGPLLLPFALEDLADDEYVVTDATHWFNGEETGTQIYAHDIFIHARHGGEWTGSRVRKAKTNSDVRVFGRPVRAIADGEVIDIEIGHRDNYLNKELPDAEANFVWVRHGDLKVKYSHLRDGSIVVFDGQSVRAGDVLGEAGNSGNTGGDPHLHLECRLVDGDSLCGMPFHKAWQLARDLVPTTGNGRRVSLAGRGICEEKAALRPFSTSRFKAERDFDLEEAPSGTARRARTSRQR
jgi:Peptidase family M23